VYRMNPRYAVHETHPLTSGFSALYRMYRMYRILRVWAGQRGHGPQFDRHNNTPRTPTDTRTQ
jgi:hypothetical protein